MANSTFPDILYTKVDEAPELASASLLPIIQSFARAADIHVEKRSFSKRKLNRGKSSLQLPVGSDAREIDEFRYLKATWVQKLIW